jgi:phage shock protein A
MTRVDSEVRKIEQRVKKFDQEARDAVHRKDRNGALQALKRKKRAEKELQDKDVQYSRLVAMLENLVGLLKSLF